MARLNLSISHHARRLRSVSLLGWPQRLLDLSLRTRLGLGLGVLLALILGQTLLVLQASQAATETSRWVARTEAAIRQANAALGAAVDMETGVRGFLLTGIDSYLEPYTRGAACYADLLMTLERQSTDDPAQASRWRAIRTQTDALRNVVLEPELALQRQVAAGTVSPDGLRVQVGLDEGKRRMDAIRAIFAEAIAVDEAHLSQRLAAASEAQHALSWTLAGGAVAAVVYALVVTFLFGGLEARALGQVAAAARRIAEGDFGDRLRLHRRDELGRLAAAFDTMAEALQHASAERAQAEEALAYQARHDPLTGLANRALFHARLEHALAAPPTQAPGVALLYLDLDNFKLINDSLGHAAGDELLNGVASRLRALVRAGDTVARLGGDEFTILLQGIRDAHDAAGIAEAITRALAAPLLVAGREVSAQASIGVALAEAQDTPDELLRKADLAVYAAKARGRGQHQLFDPSLATNARERLELELDLAQALERGEFRLHYQPLVDLATGEIRELEALLRWQHPRRGLLLPAAFLPVAEASGLIVPIGRWVLAEACRQLSAWRRAHPWLDQLCVNVNLSPRQFQDPELVALVAEALRASGIRPAQLRLEITESLAMDNVELSIATLWLLKSLGVQLAIDDFGTGHSALSYLQRFPVDTLKVDRSFVEGVAYHPEAASLARAVLSFATTLGLRTVAEGIETDEQLAALQHMECELGQGFLWATPQAPADLEHVLATRAVVPRAA